MNERILTEEMPDVRYQAIIGDVSRIVAAAKRSAARSVNAVMTAAYWMIGRRIVEFEQSGESRAEYGSALIETTFDRLKEAFRAWLWIRQSEPDEGIRSAVAS